MITKEQVWDWIDEYEKLGHESHIIKFNPKDKVKGFHFLLESNFSSIGKNEFRICGKAKRALDKAKIKYKLLRKK